MPGPKPLICKKNCLHGASTILSLCFNPTRCDSAITMSLHRILNELLVKNMKNRNGHPYIYALIFAS